MANNSFSVQLGKERLWIRMEPARYIQRHTWQVRQLNLEGIPSDPPEALSEIQFIISIDDFFENNFAEPAGEELLAKELNLSRRQLDRVLRKYYGMGYRQKLIRARMDHAAWLLRTTDWHISRIAAFVGYTSDSAFFQVFRSHFGITPSRYRKQPPKEY